MKYEFLLNEGEDETNENSSDSELSVEYSSENATNSENCTVMYDANFSPYCIEDIVSQTVDNIESVEQAEEENDPLTQEQEEEIKATATPQTLTYEEQIEFYDSVSDSLDSLNTNIESIYDFLSIICVVLFLQWVLSITNSWRRNNK